MILTIVFAVLMFSLIIFVHEFGHFITARLFGVKVHEFAIGMGPAIFSKQKGETKYSVRAIPMGGFCSMEGEDCESDDDGAFSSKPWYARLIILAAGAGMNVVLGFVICLIFVAATSSNGIVGTTVDTVTEQSELHEFLREGDKIVSINDTKVHIKRDIDFAMQQNGAKKFNIVIRRDGELLSGTFSPYEAKYSDGTPAYLIGFTPKINAATPISVVKEAFFQTVWMSKLVFVSLGMLLSGQAKVSEVSGPVGVVGAMNATAQTGGIISLIYLASFISVNIGLMNLLPIPALDGGRIFFVFVEALRRKPIPPEKEGIVHFIGLILLVGVMLFATWNDIMRLISGG